MFAAFLITLREVIEASLIVATIFGILVRLNRHKDIRIVWLATGAAAGVSVLLLGLSSLLGVKIQNLYSGEIEELIEGVLMITSAFFMTWAVFVLHKQFSHHKVELLKKINQIEGNAEQTGLFILVFTAVFREGFEIVLFLSTIFFSSNPQSILTGFAGGVIGGLLISFALFGATLRLPLYWAFRVTSLLLILFAGGLLVHGIHELAEFGVLPEIAELSIILLPEKTSFGGQMLQSVFGLTKTMNIVQLSSYATYVSGMIWYVFGRKNESKTTAP